MRLLDSLKWRYATKKFDPLKKVDSIQLSYLREAVRLSVSSYGLQLYKVLIIEDDELRKKLKKESWDQDQITDSSHLFVFCNYTDFKDEYVDQYINAAIANKPENAEGLAKYGQFMKGKIKEKSASELKNWSARQTYLALGNLLTACAELRIDACPMEGFEADAYNDILGLNEQGLNAAVIATVGYRSTEDESQYYEKIRKPEELLFQEL